MKVIVVWVIGTEIEFYTGIVDTVNYRYSSNIKLFPLRYTLLLF